MVDFISLFRIFHSWIWSKMWLDSSFLKVDNKSIPKSYRTGSWKWLRKALAKSQKILNTVEGNSMYYFVVVLVKVIWNNLNQTESSFSELEEHYKWKVVTWAPRCSPVFPSNLGISEGNLVGTGGHIALCFTGSFINLFKYGKFKVSRNEILGLTGAWKVRVWEVEGLAPWFPNVKVEFPSATDYELVGLLWNGLHP